MKKKILILSCLIFNYLQSTAQDNSGFNRWSVELNAGLNKAVNPFSPGYFSSNPEKFFAFNDVNHYALGARYMFSQQFGLRLSANYDVITNSKNSPSTEFKTMLYGVSVEGVLNVGKLAGFDKFTNRFGLLIHGGPQYSQLRPKDGANADFSEDNYGYVFGVTPQVRISNKLSANLDFTSLKNLHQNFAWDGGTSDYSNSLVGTLYTVSLGINYYLGGEETHADWYVEPVKPTIADKPAVVDSDGDGLEDSKDACPEEFGSRKLKGCPDDDEDGIANKADKCPDVKGPKDNGGCPWPDADGDGIPDKNDPCPDVKGSSANNGCPDVAPIQVNRKLLDEFCKVITYDTGRFVFEHQAYAVLYNIASILKSYPDAEFSIEGHTDSDGSETVNQKLSLERANMVKYYLMNNGIEESKLKVTGYGSSRPIDSNKTKAGKANNRRVEIKLIKK